MGAIENLDRKLDFMCSKLKALEDFFNKTKPLALSAEEAAKKLGYKNKEHLLKLAREGKIGSKKEGKFVTFPIEAIEEFAKRNVIKSNSEIEQEAKYSNNA